MHGLWQDIQYALRLLRKNPGVTGLAMLTLALGIGANTAIFSVLDPLLLRKLPVRNPDELVWVNSKGTLGPAEISEADTYYAYRDKAQVFTSVLAFSREAPCEVTHGGRTTSAKGELVSANYFNSLGVRPFAGRLFGERDEHASAVVLSFDFWRQEFDSDPKAIGKMLSFGDQADASRTGSVPRHSFVIAGVTPPQFFGTEVGESPDFYMPLGATDLPSQDLWWQKDWVTILARLKPGVSLAQAEAGLEPLLQEVVKSSTLPKIELEEGFQHILLTPAAHGLSEAREKFSLPARILMVVVALLLIIACANVANLLLARGMARRREFGVRLALGAGRWRVIRQLLTEAALLATTGGAAGLVVGEWTSHLLVVSLSTRQLPFVLRTSLNGRMLLFTVIVLTLTVLLCGLAPAIFATRGEISEDLSAQGHGSNGSAARLPLSSALLVAQVAVSVVLLAGAGLLLHSLFNLETFDAGFDRDKVVIVTMNGYSPARSGNQVAGFYDQLLEKLKQLPGVHSVSFSSFTPMSGREVGINVVVEGYKMRPGETANERFVGVSPEYFETMGIPVLAGRAFTQEDVHPNLASNQSANVAILNRTMARRFFGENNPIGKHLRLVEGNRPPMEIVGVVADSKYNNLREGATDFFYVPGTHGDMEIRTERSARTLAGSLREIVGSLDSSVTITGIRTLRAQVDESLHSDRLIGALCGAFSGLALTLTCVGLYATLAFRVVRRTSEIGIRVALGAQGRDIFRLVVGQGMRLTLCGLAVGIGAALGGGSLLSSMLFGVKQTDPLAFVGVSFILLAAAMLACFVPARRAMRVDPIAALRDE